MTREVNIKEIQLFDKKTTLEQENKQLKDRCANFTIETSFKNQSIFLKDISKKAPCSHDIIINLGCSNDKPIYCCLFCQEMDVEKLDLDNSIIIDASNYYKESFKLDNIQSIIRKLELIRNQIMKFIQYSPDITNGQLQYMINQNLNSSGYQKKYY